MTSSDKSFCIQLKIQCTQANSKFPTPHHVITNLTYRFKPHQKRSHYLKTRLDTCADVNIMPVSVYNLVFQDPDCKKHEPRVKLEIGTYTTDYSQVGWILCALFGTPRYHMPYQELTFYVASNKSSVLLSYMTTLALWLDTASCSRLDYLPPRASLITSSADHPKKTKSKISVHVSRKI